MSGRIRWAYVARVTILWGLILAGAIHDGWRFGLKGWVLVAIAVVVSVGDWLEI